MSHAFTPRTLPDTPEVYIVSFGYKYGPPPDTDITLDVRDHLYLPSNDPTFLVLTGHDREVRDHVMSAEGSTGLVDGLTYAITALVRGARVHPDRPVRVAIGCNGGLHRSVVIANELGELLENAGISVELRDRELTPLSHVTTTV